jgi:hypothetical protein
MNKYHINSDIQELGTDDIILLFKSINQHYTFYGSALNGHIYRFELVGQKVYVLELDIDKYVWSRVSYIEEVYMPEFYECYRSIIRNRKLEYLEI